MQVGVLVAGSLDLAGREFGEDGVDVDLLLAVDLAERDTPFPRSGHTHTELQAISDAWRNWAADPDGWISLLHGEILCRV
jgi:hypothetical protein